MHDACLAISRGELDVVLVTGAEAMYARALARRDPARPWLEWASQPDGTPPASLFGVEKAGRDRARDAARRDPADSRLPLVRERPARRQRLDAARSTPPASVASGPASARWPRAIPHAWIRTRPHPDEIVTPAPGNRMVSFPYPSSARPTCRSTRALPSSCARPRRPRAAGVPEERWVFPLAGADGNDHWFISERPELHRSPAIRLAGAAALQQAGLGIDDIAFVDLYSCFPAVVQIAADELGLALDDPGRPLTLTGGLTFGGGPGNNYTSHGIARAVGALRGAPGSAALVTGLGWYATKHSLGVYASRPPAHGGGRHFAWRNVQPAVDALPRCRVDPDATGAVRSRPTPSPSTATAHPSAASSPAAPPAAAGPGATWPMRTRSRCSVPRRASAAPARWPPTAPSTSTGRALRAVRRFDAGDGLGPRTYGARMASAADERAPGVRFVVSALPRVRAGGPPGRPEHGPVPHAALPPRRLAAGGRAGGGQRGDQAHRLGHDQRPAPAGLGGRRRGRDRRRAGDPGRADRRRAGPGWRTSRRSWPSAWRSCCPAWIAPTCGSFLARTRTPPTPRPVRSAWATSSATEPPTVP